MLGALIFEDGKGELGPLADLRPACAIRTGALTTLERLALVLKIDAQAEVRGVFAPAAIAALAAEHTGLPVNDLGVVPATRDGVLLVNGRCALPPEGLGQLGVGEALTDGTSGHVLAARLSIADAKAFLIRFELPPKVSVRASTERVLLARPWDVIRTRDDAINIDLQSMMGRPTQELPPGVIGINDELIRISPDALIYPSVVLDAEHGPIFIDDHATIRPGAVVVGPAYIGKASSVLERTLIKANTAIGPVCKVAGEVGGSIFQGFSNKGHDGHLGDSWVGEWANFGAGTTNSNLLNTYGEVIAQSEPNGPRQRTGLQFLGCIVADHVKLAILTRIMTGSVFGTGSMIADPNPPTVVGRFEWLTPDRRQPYRFEKFIEVARAVMSRRKITLSKECEARLRALAPA